MASLLTALLAISALYFCVQVYGQDATSPSPSPSPAQGSLDPNASSTGSSPGSGGGDSTSPNPDAAANNGTQRGSGNQNDDTEYDDSDQDQQGQQQGGQQDGNQGGDQGGNNNGTDDSPPPRGQPGQDQQGQGLQGQQQGASQNTTRIPLSQAKLPAAAPLKQHPVTYRLQWKDAMDNGNPIIDYRIRYWQRDQNQSEAKSARSVADYVDLKGLLPGEIYQAEIKARNQIGEGPPLSMTFKTQFVTNSTDVSQTCMTEIVDRTSTTLLLDFFHQDANKQDIDGYEVKYVAADQPFEYAATRLLDRYAASYMVTGLVPGIRYRFRVNTRISGRGQGTPCGEFDTIMPEVGAPLAPKAAVGSTVTFQLQWEIPNNKSVRHYRIDYWADPRFGETPNRLHEIVEAPNRAMNLTSLQPCQKYQVEISPRSRPQRRQRGGAQAQMSPYSQNMPRMAHILKLYFTTDCTIVTGSVENSGFSL